MARAQRLLCGLAALSACGNPAGERPLLVEATAELGVDVTHELELSGEFLLPEIMGSGLAVFDADGDARLDLYFVAAGRTRGDGAPNRLLLQGADGRFADASAGSGLDDRGYGMGVAVGDADRDGDVDVYVGNWGRDALYGNGGEGRFADVTAAAGLGDDQRWTTSVAFLDADLDGWLDLFAVHYVRFEASQQCTSSQSRREYCGPTTFAGESDALYRNLGGLRFEDTSGAAGIARQARNGLGVLVCDVDGDGWSDVYVANDGEANALWLNQRDGRFEDRALSLGAAVDATGAAEASMGVAAGDVDGDGDFDLFATHLESETNTLYRREPHGFVDASHASGLGRASLPYTGFGTVLFDIEHDGDLDVALVNGRVEQGEPLPGVALDPLWARYAEPNLLFLGDGTGAFRAAPVAGAGFCAAVEVSRGLAAADLDGDGDLDLVVTNCRGPARVYRNERRGGHWLGVRVLDEGGRVDVFGACVRVRAGGRVQVRSTSSAQSYLTSVLAPLHFGLGSARRVESLEVTWPGGAVEWFEGTDADRVVTLVRGRGRS